MPTISSPGSGPVVVVTGASQGIGAAIVECFASQVPDARLALVARNREKLEAVAARCRSLGAGRAEIFQADLADPLQVECLSADIHAAFGRVDTLINNAGQWRGGAVHEMTVADFTTVLQENVVSMFAVTRAFLPGMLARGVGDIIFMSSTSGLAGVANQSAYCAAKHGVAGLAKALRVEVAGRGIRVCCVYPGGTETPTWDGSNVDPARLMTATDVAQVVVGACGLSGRAMMEEVVLRPSQPM